MKNIIRSFRICFFTFDHVSLNFRLSFILILYICINILNCNVYVDKFRRLNITLRTPMDVLQLHIN